MCSRFQLFELPSSVRAWHSQNVNHFHIGLFCSGVRASPSGALAHGPTYLPQFLLILLIPGDWLATNFKSIAAGITEGTHTLSGREEIEQHQQGGHATGARPAVIERGDGGRSTAGKRTVGSGIT